MLEGANTDIADHQGLKLSFVVPVHDRPLEVKRLLASLADQSLKDFEVVIVEDGSSDRCNKVVSEFGHSLSIKYIENELPIGPGPARNIGCKAASGNFYIFVDSDCFLPQDYVETLTNELGSGAIDAFGGPDTGHVSFSTLQKAIDYSMTSVLTTGGIRGGRGKFDLFYPKGFNMGVKKEGFDTLGGFRDMRYGEDTELSYRIRKAKYKVKFLDHAYVHHKRRNSLVGFSRQVYNSGRARILISRMHTGTLKLLHLLPTLALFTLLSLAALSFYNTLFLLPIICYAMAICIHASVVSRSLVTGLVAIATSAVQVCSYGAGFIVQACK